MDKPYEFCTYCGDSDWEGACCATCGMPSVTVRLRSAQAKIDALMWEYCPDEMTKEQKREWAKHQVEA